MGFFVVFTVSVSIAIIISIVFHAMEALWASREFTLWDCEIVS